MAYYPDLKTLFIHIPKTAGTSIRGVFCEKSRMVGAVHDTIKSSIVRWGDGICDNNFSFAIVRNPWDRIVSFYGMYCTRFGYEKDFKTFLRSGLKGLTAQYFFKNQLYWLKDDKNKIRVRKIYLFEELDFCWKDICKNIDIDIKLIHLHKSDYNKPSYHYYYDNTTRKIVHQWYQDDIDYFDFKFDNS